MSLVIRPPRRGCSSCLCLQAPPSKSMALRALAAGAVAGGGRLWLDPGPLGEDVVCMVKALEALGYPVARQASGLLEVGARPPGLSPRRAVLDAGEGAAPARFLLALAARESFPVTVTGRGRLPERPMEPLVAALQHLGVQVEGGPGLPLTVQGPYRACPRVLVDSRLSSQFLSALLLALPGLGQRVLLDPGGEVASPGYLELTRSVLRAFGASFPHPLRVESSARLHPTSLVVERDWSGATVLLAAAAFLGRPVRVEGLSLDSSQPERGFARILADLGMHLMASGGGVEAWGEPSRGGLFSLASLPDSVPALAALAALSPAAVQIEGVAHLRVKESNRLVALLDLFAALQVEAKETPAGLIIAGSLGSAPREAAPIPVATRGDHRIAMAAALLGLIRPVRLDNAACVAKSFPGFFEQWPGCEGLREGPGGEDSQSGCSKSDFSP